MRRYKKNRVVSDIDTLFSYSSNEPMSCREAELIENNSKNWPLSIENASRFQTYQNFPYDSVSYNRGELMTGLYKI